MSVDLLDNLGLRHCISYLDTSIEPMGNEHACGDHYPHASENTQLTF